MTEQRYIVHIDMDAFFASVEQMDNPKLAGRPLIVGGDPKGRGVVAACSYEARKFGIHSAMSGARAVKRCPQALFVRPRKDRYREVSAQIMAIFKDFSPLVEPLSLDEAFLDISEGHESFSSAAATSERIRSRIFQDVGLTCSAGVSYNKFLAKVASDMDKPNGLTVITIDQARSFLSSLPVGKFHGVGQVTEKKMHGLGIHTGQDLLRFPRSQLQTFFGKAGDFFYDIVRGRDERPVQNSRGRKSIGTETTLKRDILDLNQMEEILGELSRKIEETLLKKHCGGNSVTLKVRYHDFTTVTRSTTLPAPLHSAGEIMQHIPGLLRATEAGRKKVRLLGITLSKLSDTSEKSPVQLHLPFS
ncbi:MAG: DNA polymerase IV [Thermodesulfobacteriota bacterium]